MNSTSMDSHSASPGTAFQAMLSLPELVFEFSKHLYLEDLISLYTVSRDFHRVVNYRYMAIILGQAQRKAPESASIFAHRCYKELCILDPAQRPMTSDPSQIRWVPSFRWLRMIFWREQCVESIIHSLALEGISLPRGMSLTLKKFWFTLDLSDNARRAGLFHNREFWQDKDLFLASMFIVKLDLRLTCPLRGNGETGLRSMLLNQRSLSTLAKVLRREAIRTQLDMLRMHVEYSYEPAPHACGTILGVPAALVGSLQYESWGHSRIDKFIPIDTLVGREAIRRRIDLRPYYLDMMLHGFIDKQTWENNRRPTDTDAPRTDIF